MFLKTWNIETRETVGEATADSFWNHPKSPAIINSNFFFHGLRDLSFPTRIEPGCMAVNSLFFYRKFQANAFKPLLKNTASFLS